MSTIDRGLDLLLGKLEELARAEDPRQRAAYKAVLPLMQDWLAPTEDRGALARRIEQDLDQICREIDQIRHAYKAAIQPEGKRRAG
jgi:hypothetical protein